MLIGVTPFSQRDIKYLPPMNTATGLDNDTTKSFSPPDALSKSTNMPRSTTNLTDLGSHQAASGPTLYGRSSYATIDRKTISNERLDGATGASPGAAPSRPSRTKESRPADHQSTAVSATVSMDHQGTAQRIDSSQFGVEADARSRAGQVSPRVAIVLPPIVLTDDRPL